jgi:hypothetical protein
LAFIDQYKKPLQKEFYSPQEIAKAIGKSRRYILDALTGYGNREEPRLKAQKKGARWIISKTEAERFIRKHVPD